ncbi:MAG TPA: DUF2567 domain-containing protein [Planosporangium sp.]|jgi:hypothetical protein|nr:DUF2567 domain-containing protein [Planosporangium sp.]
MTAALAPQPLPDPASPPARDRGLRREALIALAVAAALAALGLPLGLLWRAVSPKVEFVMTEAGATTVQPEPEGFVAGDGWYVLITFTAGVLAAIAVWTLVRRRRGPLMLLGLVVGGVAGGVLTAWLGHQIGYGHYRQLIAHAPVGAHFLRPPSVRSGSVGLWYGFLPRVQGAVLVQAVAAALTYLMLAAFHVEPDLRRPVEPAQPRQPFEPAQPTGPAESVEPADAVGSTTPAEPTGPADAVSSGPTGSTAPPESPVPPGSDPAAPPRG